MKRYCPFRFGIFLFGLLFASTWAFTQSSAPEQRASAADSCGPADSAYIRTANQTGGVPLFLQRSEAAKTFQLVRESSRDNVSTVVWATGLLNGPGQSITIPIDSVTQRITFVFSVNTKGAKIVLKDPSGDLLTNASPKTEDTELNCGRIVTVTSPAPGDWRAEITGTGMFWLEAKAQSDIHFIHAAFVRPGGRPGHQGYFRIEGQPLAGAPATLQIALSGKETQSAEFHFVNERGDRIQKLSLRPSNETKDWLEFEGPVQLPQVPFRIAAVGLDSSGYKYERFFSGLFHAESVEVIPSQDAKELKQGNAVTIAFTVHNLGATRSYRITVSDAHKYVNKVEPAELALNAGDSAVVHVALTVPPTATPGTGDDVVVVAASTSGSSTSNSSVLHFIVSAPAVSKPSH